MYPCVHLFSSCDLSSLLIRLVCIPWAFFSLPLVSLLLAQWGSIRSSSQHPLGLGFISFIAWATSIRFFSSPLCSRDRFYNVAIHQQITWPHGPLCFGRHLKCFKWTKKEGEREWRVKEVNWSSPNFHSMINSVKTWKMLKT